MNQLNPTYYYLLLSQIDFFENQVIEEILRERATFYDLQNRIRDFWLVLQPSFLIDSQLEEKIKRTCFYNSHIKKPENNEQNGMYFVSLISMDKNFLKWIELRIGHFEDLGSFEKPILPNNVTPDYKTTQPFTSNGLLGSFDQNSLCCSFISQTKNIHPKILSEKYQRTMRFFNEF